MDKFTEIYLNLITEKVSTQERVETFKNTFENWTPNNSEGFKKIFEVKDDDVWGKKYFYKWIKDSLKIEVDFCPETKTYHARKLSDQGWISYSFPQEEFGKIQKYVNKLFKNSIREDLNRYQQKQAKKAIRDFKEKYGNQCLTIEQVLKKISTLEPNYRIKADFDNLSLVKTYTNYWVPQSFIFLKLKSSKNGITIDQLKKELEKKWSDAYVILATDGNIKTLDNLFLLKDIENGKLITGKEIPEVFIEKEPIK